MPPCPSQEFLDLPDAHSEDDLHPGLDEFKPEYLGKLEFYLEALDRNVRMPHESPSIGLLLCATKDSEVVEYALGRTMSPALVAEYRTRLPERHLLQAKLHELYQQAVEENPVAAKEPKGSGTAQSAQRVLHSARRRQRARTK